MLLCIQDFLYVLILLQQVVITELTALDFVSYRFFQHCEPFFQDLSKGKVFIKCLFALDQIDDGQKNFSLLLSEPPNIKSPLHFSFKIFGNSNECKFMIKTLFVVSHLIKLLFQFNSFILELLFLLTKGIQLAQNTKLKQKYVYFFRWVITLDSRSMLLIFSFVFSSISPSFLRFFKANSFFSSLKY